MRTLAEEEGLARGGGLRVGYRAAEGVDDGGAALDLRRAGCRGEWEGEPWNHHDWGEGYSLAASSRGVMHTSSVYSSTTLLVRLKKSLCRLKKPARGSTTLGGRQRQARADG